MQNDVIWNPRRQRGERADMRSVVRRILQDLRSDLGLIQARRERRYIKSD